jgi:hypothetical protein
MQGAFPSAAALCDDLVQKESAAVHPLPAPPSAVGEGDFAATNRIGFLLCLQIEDTRSARLWFVLRVILTQVEGLSAYLPKQRA